MNNKLMIKWLDTIIAKRKRKIAQGKKGLLILDNMPAHTCPNVRERAGDLNFDIMYLPPNTTSILQPLDIGVN